MFPSSSYHDVMDAMSRFFFFVSRSCLIYFSELENLDQRLLNIRRVVQGLPQANFDILRRVSEHLDR